MTNKRRVLVVGSGSVGRRHIANLVMLGAEVSSYRYRQELAGQMAEELRITSFPSLEAAFDAKPDAVVVANRTDLHMAVALEAARRGCHLYLEKPVSNTLDGTEELRAIVAAKALVVEVGCMLRFHPNLRCIKQLLGDSAIGTPYSVRVFHGQYLPDWRPTQDYRQGYSAFRHQGGGIVLDWIHEIDYLLWWFGAVDSVTALVDHVSALETDTEDVADMLLRFRSGLIGNVHLDCLRPFLHRGCEIVTSNAVIAWDYVAGTVTVQRRGDDEPQVFRTPQGFERNTMFVDAMQHFLDRIEVGGEPVVSLDEGIEALKIALEVISDFRFQVSD